MDQNIESKILEKRKLCKVLKVFKIVSFIGIFAPFVAFMVVSRNGYELDSAWLLIPALFVGGFFLFSYMETNKLKDLKELMGQYVVRSVLGERLNTCQMDIQMRHFYIIVRFFLHLIIWMVLTLYMEYTGE